MDVRSTKKEILTIVIYEKVEEFWGLHLLLLPSGEVPDHLLIWPLITFYFGGIQ